MSANSIFSINNPFGNPIKEFLEHRRIERRDRERRKCYSYINSCLELMRKWQSAPVNWRIRIQLAEAARSGDVVTFVQLLPPPGELAWGLMNDEEREKFLNDWAKVDTSLPSPVE